MAKPRCWCSRAYLCIVVATVAVAAPADEKTNQVGARIMSLEGDMVVGRYFVVTNESRSHWYDVIFEIDGGYSIHKDLVHAGEKVTLFLKDFHREETIDRHGTPVTRKVAAPLDLPGALAHSANPRWHDPSPGRQRAPSEAASRSAGDGDGGRRRPAILLLQICEKLYAYVDERNGANTRTISTYRATVAVRCAAKSRCS